ncbi:hypothetical protein X793_03700 [Dehalococcoides mccartyi CG4]|uniref:DUF192 domain-containing protein n=1 Tax=Dehalococcoides mccartyi TaxID=61435 RepID=UPI0004E09570|nr:DUF192 domain-containing protein [Dehalococcoides mccartyi]AII60191.1 hypothetical protein X793_03700 [Dehalococcoides mccartyi CG4]
MARQATIQIGDREWLVDVATQPWELSQGLGGLSGLLAGTGMLFDLGWEQIIEMTTVPMLFPLDIAFFSENLTITEMYRNVEPGYLVTSQSPARYFLEINAGELADIEAGNQAKVVLLSSVNTAATSDWTPAMFGFMGLMMMGILMTGIVRDLTAEALKEPERKPLLYGPRGEKLLAHTARKVDLWVEIASVVESELGKRTEIPPGQLRQVAEVVADRVEKRAGELAWIEFRDGTTFERKGKAPINQGLKIFAALDGYLGLTTKLWHADRIAVADMIDERLKEAVVIVLRDGTIFQKAFVPGRFSPATATGEDKPAGTCYADAWRFLINKGEGKLVHGTVYSGDRRIGHAWVETGYDSIWEPQTGNHMTKLAYRYEASPIEEHRYTPEEASIMVERTRHFGPWTDEDRSRYLGDKSTAVIHERKQRTERRDGLDLLSDSPEFLAYTIDDIGFREIIDSAFRQAISRARGIK